MADVSQYGTLETLLVVTDLFLFGECIIQVYIYSTHHHVRPCFFEN